MKQKNSDYLESVKDKTIKAGYLSIDTLNFYKSVFEYHEKYTEEFNKISRDCSYIEPVQHPAVNADRLEFSSEEKSLFTEGLEFLVNLILLYHKGLNFDPLLEKYRKDDLFFENTIKYLLKRDPEKLKKFSEKLKIGIDEYLFIIVNLFKPYIINLRIANPVEILTEGFLETHCPFCGYYPEINRIIESKENMRILHCGFCENEWRFRRMTCTICGNSDVEKLGYFITGKDSFYRVDYCDECKGYIKTVIIKKHYDEEKYNLSVENIITAFLDASTIDLGYVRP